MELNQKSKVRKGQINYKLSSNYLLVKKCQHKAYN